MGTMSKRKPHQLSGGQQQRVALARALVLEPTVLLLDEPMGALDAKLRKQLQLELRSLQKTVGTTFVYVTHDQDEALTMSDRLAVLDKGKVMQIGTPSEVYSTPANTHVATFLGTSNLWEAEVLAAGPDGLHCRIGEVDLRISGNGPSAGDTVSVMVRPERVTVAQAPDADRSREHAARPGGHDDLPRRPHLGAARLLRAASRGRRGQRRRRAHPTWLCEGAQVSVQVSPNALRVLGSDDPVPTDQASVSEAAVPTEGT